MAKKEGCDPPEERIVLSLLAMLKGNPWVALYVIHA
jgi:hypothetical protein